MPKFNSDRAVAKAKDGALPARRPTMIDVAALAKVSQQTVSRVVAGHSAVRDSTRQRVLEAIEEIHYKPNYAAQLLASGTSRSVGVLTVGKMFLGMNAIFTSLEQAQRKSGRYVLSASTSSGTKQAVLEALAYLQSQSVVAIVMICQDRHVLPVLTQPIRVPLILTMAGRPQIPGVLTASLAQTMGACHATMHLLEQGAKNIVHVAGDFRYEDALLRAQEFERICSEKNVQYQVCQANGWSARAGYQTVMNILAHQTLPDAFFAGNDNLAIGVMRACAEYGYQAGKDYAIVGFDNSDTCDYMWPSISSVNQDFGAIALKISRQIDALIRGKVCEDVEVPCELVIRESSIRNH